MMKEKDKVDGLELIDYKDIERAALGTIREGRISVMNGDLMLTHAREAIRLLGGLNSEEQDAFERKNRNSWKKSKAKKASD